MVIEKAKHAATMIDVAVPLDWNVKDKENMILKYQELRIEIQKLLITKVKVILIIVGSLGTTSMNFEKHLREIL